MSEQLDIFASRTGNPQPAGESVEAGPYMDRSYLSYAVSVLMSRAIPDVRDGLKPVHRRILYAMSQLGLNARAAHKKSARVVGDVIGKYHPHGDASVYDAMVLMAQPFNLRHPLIDGQGNWGSLDGDSPAAMRYTECRMARFAQVFLEEINKGTVDFRPNYDGNDLEPVTLPVRVPAVLLNDQMGIAVGMASDIPAHNLGETCKAAIALFKNPNTTLLGLMRHVKGPDFPCGAQVINSRDELEEIYATGRGMLTVRARYEIKQDADGWHLVFTELPPKVSPENVQLELDALSNPQPKKHGKKGNGRGAEQLTPEQRAAKLAMLARVSEINNGAGNDTGPVYLEVYPKSRRQKPDELANYLFSVTSLETKVKVNMNLINLAGLPAQMGLLDILRDWNQYRVDTVTRRCESRMEKVEARIHILDGFVKVLLDMDEVIRIIRASDNDQIAKQALMERWDLSEIQADKILDMKLRQLTRLDELAIEKELAELRTEQVELNRLLGDRAALVELIIAELELDIATYATPRRTVIEETQAAAFDDSLIDEPVTIVLSRKGWLRSRSGHNLELSALTFKDDDGLHTVIETRTSKSFLLFDENGRAYTVAASLVPGGRGDGVPITSLVDVQDRARIISMFTAHEKDRLLLASSIGYGFITEAGNLAARNKAGKAVLNTAGGTALPPILLRPGEERVAAINRAGYLLVFALDEIQEYPKGKGNKLIHLKGEEDLVALKVFSEVLELPPKRANAKHPVPMKNEDVEPYVRKRGMRGRLVPRNVSVETL
ncbi:MAG: DNA topoisomerase IV subunit A [Deferrisomatales bacterium]|nr:DNA topoisomerase IV subunit A [Deferrisomatales bacterium]